MTDALARLRNPSKGPYAVMAATGTTQADAAEMPADVVMVTSGAEDAGVILPLMNVNEECIVCNGTSANIKVYPRSGGTLNNAAANEALLMPENSAARFRAIDGGGNVMAFF